MKLFKKITAIVLTIFILITSLKMTKVEASSTSIRASQSEVTVGTPVNIIGTVTAGAWNVSINGNGVSKQLVGQTDVIGNKTVTVEASFTPQAPGTYTFTLTGEVTDFDTDKNENVSKSTTVTVKEKSNNSDNNNNSGNNNNNNNNSNNNSGNSGGSTTQRPTIPSETGTGNSNNNNNNNNETPKSSNNYLSSISIVGMGSLSPEFYRETYEYTVEYEDTVNLYDLTEIQLEAKAEDDRATVNGTGTAKLEPGENTITIIVTAENGSERSYTIKVNKPQNVEQSELRLKSLIINGINKNGEYKAIDLGLEAEVFEYDLIVPNEITALSINPTTENEDIIVEKIGSDNLEEGDNKIEIVLTSPSDKEIKTTYVLNVKREAGVVEAQGITKEQIAMIAGAVVILILLIVVVILIIRHKKKKKDNENAFGYNFENDLGNDTDANNEEINIESNNNEKIDSVDDIELPKLKWEKSLENNIEENAEIDNEEDTKKRGKRFI